MDLFADDEFLPVLRRQLHLLPQQPILHRLGSDPPSARPPGMVSGWCVTSTTLTWTRFTRPSQLLGLVRMAIPPKVNCATCHNGVYKPLFGVGMAKDFPELTVAK